MPLRDRLSGHVIASVEVVDVVTRYPRLVGRNAVLGHHGSGPTASAAILRTGDAATGWGLVRGRPTQPQTLVGRRVTDLIDPDVGVIDSSALWADIALHDLAGVLTSQPVYQMLGATGRPAVPVYDGSIYFDDLDPEDAPGGIDVVLANVQEGWDEGYRAFKLKIGRGRRWMTEAEGLERDVLVTQAVREAFPAAKLLVDGNNGFTVDGIISYLERVRDVGLYWIEEPFHEHREGLERLRGWIDANSPGTLIADGEYEPSIDEVVRLARDGLIDVLLMDILDFGLTPWRKLARELGGTGIRVSPHAWALPLKTLYAAHLAACLSEADLVEGVRGQTLGVNADGCSVTKGALVLTGGPGFGVPPPQVS